MKTPLTDYIFCALWGMGGVKLAMILQYLPAPEEAVQAIIISLLSAAAGITLRYVVSNIKSWWKVVVSKIK